MFIISKKKILCFFLAIFLFMAIVQIKNENNVQIQETVALPVNRKVIVLDAGHGGEDRRSYSRRYF